ALVQWQRLAQSGYQPRRLVLAIPAREQGLPGALAGMLPGPGVRAYRCAGTQCSAPIDDLDALRQCLAVSNAQR
ncbi:MAG TPA: hypothetical protein VLM84_07775, partial [Chromatiaceae bacterium]|nr:hypothetical protein [Chromatiaceae bacterium]